jgi:hypothetical protein
MIVLDCSKPAATPACCRHCGRAKVNRPRGLCWTCYYRPGVKDRYPSESKFARRGLGNNVQELPLPASPTTAVPGSPAKLAVMQERAKAGVALWHPADAEYRGDPAPLGWLKRGV